MARKGHDFKDYICPDGIEKHSDYLKLGDRYCRVLFLKDYANYIQDEIVANLTDMNRWSRVVRSARNSLLSLRCNSMS